MNVSGSSPWAWCDVQCWAESFFSLGSLWWGHAGCHSGAPSQSGLSWWTVGSLRSAECWWMQHTVKTNTNRCAIHCQCFDNLVWFCASVNLAEDIYLRFLRKDAGSFANKVFTRPNSCMTLSSCLRSSWPFNRNMNSWPLLPADGATNTAFVHWSKLCKNHYIVAVGSTVVFSRVPACCAAAVSPLPSPQPTSARFTVYVQ